MRGNLSIGHTRWATHGEVSDTNSHPHLDCSEQIAVAHNGIFENFQGIKNRLQKKGHKFISETDTETISHFIEDEIANGSAFEKAVEFVFTKMQGLNAIVAIHKNYEKIVAIKNGSPLVVGYGNGENFIASDPSALLPWTKKVYFMKNYDLAIIGKRSVKFKNLRTGKYFFPDIQILKWQLKETRKGSFPYYMEKEIHEQPKVIEGIFSGNRPSNGILKVLKNARNIYLLGCGSAYFAAVSGSYLFSKVSKMQAIPVVGSEFLYKTSFLNSRDVVLAISQSGETMDILESINKAKEKRAKIIALVNIQGSSLYRLSDYQILINAGPEKSVASTKALTGMIAQLLFLANSLNENNKININYSKIVLSIKEVLSIENLKIIKKLSDELKDKDHIYIIGRGLSYPAALESAIKIKEISYIHAEGLAAGELKHGPLALIEKNTPCIVFIPNDETFESNLAAAEEMKARGGFIIGISPKKHRVMDRHLPIMDVSETSIIPNIITSQLLAYYLTISKKLDPDMPRNLAKSVTVK